MATSDSGADPQPRPPTGLEPSPWRPPHCHRLLANAECNAAIFPPVGMYAGLRAQRQLNLLNPGQAAQVWDHTAILSAELCILSTK